MLAGMVVLTAPLSCSGAADWQAAQITDTMRAAPPTVAWDLSTSGASLS
jgi:hypothetical protein